MAQLIKNPPALWETWVWSLGGEDPLEKGMATHSSILGWADPLEKEMATHSSTLAWKIPWMEEPHRLESTGSQRVVHDWATSLHYEHSCTNVGGGLFSFLLSIFLGMELLGRIAIPCWTIWGTSRPSKAAAPLHSDWQWRRVLYRPHPHQYLLTSMLLFTAFLVGVKWHLTVVLMGISLMISGAVFSLVYWPFVYFLWRKVYWDPLVIFHVILMDLIGDFV